MRLKKIQIFTGKGKNKKLLYEIIAEAPGMKSIIPEGVVDYLAINYKKIEVIMVEV